MEVNVERLRTLRRLRAMSQEELAAALGVGVEELVAVEGNGA